jgi:hypothetical protein
LFVAGGCWTTSWTTKPNLKPPPHPEEYTVPPADDARFSAPIEYPKGTLNQDMIKKPSSDQDGPGGGPSRFGAGPGSSHGF